MVEGERGLSLELELPRTYYLQRGEAAAENPEARFSISAVISEARNYSGEARNLFLDSFARTASRYLRVVGVDDFQFQFVGEENQAEARKIANWLSVKAQQPKIVEAQREAVNFRLSGL